MSALRTGGLSLLCAMIGVRVLLVLGILRTVRGQDPSGSVRVEVTTLDNGVIQFICVEDSSPTDTKYIWKRKETFDSDAVVELGHGKTFSGKSLPSAFYICEVTNPFGKSSGYLYFYNDSGSSVCLHVCLWSLLVLLLALSVFFFCSYKKTTTKKQ